MILPVKVGYTHVLMGTGSFYTAYSLAAADIIDSSYLSACPCCEDSVRENFEHIFRVCSIFSNQRLLIFDDIISRFQNHQDGGILRGETHVYRNLHVQVTVASTTYLSLIVLIRIRLLERLVS